MAVYGLVDKMRFTIIQKLKRAGAINSDKAVTSEEADLSWEELRWLLYLAGGALSTIKKTEDGRYYV